MTKVVLLGMNNPLSREPRHALFPHPVGCAGWRIWQMLRDACGVSRGDYLSGFERVNILDGESWDREKAESRAPEIVKTLVGREVVVFGEEARRALELPRVLIHPVFQRGVLWRQLPHPSGRNLWYNEPTQRMLASLLLWEMYERGRKSCE